MSNPAKLAARTPFSGKAYPDLLQVLGRSRPAETAAKVTGQNWLRIVGAVLG